jgi:NTE family protein
MNNKVALVLSGGGARGAFQFGAIKYIEKVLKQKHPGLDYSIIAGVSVGALNAGMLAMGKFHELERIWSTITNDKVYRGKNFLCIVWRLITGRKSALSNMPLQIRIAKHFHLADVNTSKHDLRIGVVSLFDGRYRMVKPDDLEEDASFHDAVLASTAIPILWEPVEVVKLKDGGRIHVGVDGGVRNVSPLGDVLADNPSHIIIINCSSLQLENAPSAGKNIIEIAMRSFEDVMMNEIFASDVDQFLKINRLVKQAESHGVTLRKDDGSAYKYFNSVRIEPDEDMGDTLDFSREQLRWRIEKGFEVAEREFEGFTFT